MTARIALALLVIVPAAMAYPWHSTTDRWILGVAVAVLLIVFAWWRGLFLTSAVSRRMAIWRRNRGKAQARRSNHVTVVLRVSSPDGTPLPIRTIAGYVERFGIRCDAVRITSLDAEGSRTTWVGMTLGAVDNLAALQARSASLPLSDTAEVVGRRLADHLREAGLDAVTVDTAPVPVAVGGRETWRGVADDAGFVSAYAVEVDAQLTDRVASARVQPAVKVWTAVEFSGTTARPTVAAVIALRTDTAPDHAAVVGLNLVKGRQRPVLTALDPRSAERLGVDAIALPDGLLDALVWQADPMAAVS